MKLLGLELIISLLLIPLLFTPAISGTLYKWTDENGVMHISTIPPPEDIEHKKSKYKDSPENNPSKAKKTKFKPIYDPNKETYYLRQEERRKKAEKEKAERAEKREREAEERRGKREVETAKRQYEFLEGQREKYRAYYLDATTTHYRNHWYKKLREVDEARSKYFRLRDKYGE